MSLSQRGGRYSLLDFSRFLAAISVVIYHYQHFLPKAEIEKLPWYPLIAIFIQKGHLAVPFFWFLSGFVIASTYPPKARNNVTTFLSFRFARLYPLHLLTLLLVTLLQFISNKTFGKAFIYADNNFPNFLLHFFFLSGFSESFNGRYSFNGPIWSVSLELMCYFAFAFFMLMSILRIRLVFLFLTIILFADIITPLPDQLIRVNLFFFSGVLLYLLRAQIRVGIRAGFYILSFVLFVLTLGDNPLRIGVAFPSLQIYQFRYVFLFATVLLILLWLEPHLSNSASSKFTNLGDLSYGMYLLHIPLQLLLIIVILRFGSGTASIFTSSWFFICFLCFLLAISSFVYNYFEKPSRKYIRRIVVEKWR